MRNVLLLRTGVIAGAAAAAAISMQSAFAGTPEMHPVGVMMSGVHLHEHTAGKSFLDLGSTGPGFGDELVGANTLTAEDGSDAGTDSFVCTSVAADDSAFQCDVVFSLKGGRVTAQGYAKITGTAPLFDEKFAVTGGTGDYQRVTGQVRVLQSSGTDAELTLQLNRSRI